MKITQKQLIDFAKTAGVAPKDLDSHLDALKQGQLLHRVAHGSPSGSVWVDSHELIASLASARQSTEPQALDKTKSIEAIIRIAIAGLNGLQTDDAPAASAELAKSLVSTH